MQDYDDLRLHQTRRAKPGTEKLIVCLCVSTERSRTTGWLKWAPWQRPSELRTERQKTRPPRQRRWRSRERRRLQVAHQRATLQKVPSLRLRGLRQWESGRLIDVCSADAGGGGSAEGPQPPQGAAEAWCRGPGGVRVSTGRGGSASLSVR